MAFNRKRRRIKMVLQVINILLIIILFLSALSAYIKLKPGGKSFMDIQSGDYADAHFPQQLWDAGEKGLTLSSFEWNPESRIMLYGQNDFAYGDVLYKPEMPCGNPTRLYTKIEIEDIMKNRGMKVISAYSDYCGTIASEKGFQLIVCSRKL